MIALLLAALACAAPSAPGSPGAPLAPESHGDVAWFDGSFDAALARARTSGRPVFVDFWASWCRPCREMDKTTFRDAAVVAELARTVAVSIDADSELGQELSLRFGVEMLPTMVFLNAKGEPQDELQGYRDPAALRADLARLLRDEGTVDDLRRRTLAAPDDPFLRFDLLETLDRVGAVDAAAAEADELRRRFASAGPRAGETIDWRARLRRRFRGIGDEESAAQQLAAMRRLDPDGTSLALHRVEFERHIDRLRLEFDGAPLRAFLAGETHPELLYEGWKWIALLEFTLGERALADEEAAAARDFHRAGAAAYRAMWAHVPASDVAELGREMAARLYARRADLDRSDLELAAEAARRSAAATPERALAFDTLARCLEALGDAAGALAAAERAVALEPANAKFRARLERLADGGSN